MSVLKVKDELGVWKSIPTVETFIDDGSLEEAKFSDDLKLKTIKDYVTPEMFGAKGDGVTDDSGAIQDAIDSGACEIHFGAKTYLIDEAIDIQRDNVRFVGSMSPVSNPFDNGTVLMATEASSGDVFTIGSSSLRVYGIAFENLTIKSVDSNRSTQNMDNHRTVLNIRQGTDIHIDNSLILGFSSTALNLIDAWDCYYNSLTILLCGTADAPAIVLGASSDNTNAQHFSNCRVEHCPYIMDISGGVNNQFIGCKFEIGTLFYTPTQTGFIRIRNNTSYGNVFSSCFFANSSTTVYMFFLHGNTNQNVITGCTFDTGVGNVLYIRTGDGHSHIISNNTFRRCASQTIYINNTFNVNIVNNSFAPHNNATNVIYINGDTNVVVGNQLTTYKTVLAFINIAGGGENRVYGNSYYGTITGAYKSADALTS